MTQIYRRQRQVYLFTGIVSAIAIINVLFYLILYRPTRSDYFRLQDSIQRLRLERASREVRVRQKEKIGTQLETSDQDRQELFLSHFIPVDVGFTQVLPDLEHMAKKAGVRKTRVDYSGGVNESPQYGLYSVKIRIPVQGSYSSIANFIKELENSETFYVVTSVDVRSGSDSTFQPGAGSVTLSLGLEAFFYQ